MISLIRSPISLDTTVAFTQRILDYLRAHNEPQTRTLIRNTLRVKNERLGLALKALQQQGLVDHAPAGWEISRQATPPIEVQP